MSVAYELAPSVEELGPDELGAGESGREGRALAAPLTAPLTHRLRVVTDDEQNRRAHTITGLRTSRPGVTAFQASPHHRGLEMPAAEPLTVESVRVGLRPEFDAGLRVASRPSVVELPARRVSAGVSGTPGAVRLTRRGYVALGLLTGIVGAVLLFVAHASAPTDPQPRADVPAVVQVQPGDTLWSIAAEIAPTRDPRDVVAELRSLNHLTGTDLAAGQSLVTR